MQNEMQLFCKISQTGNQTHMGELSLLHKVSLYARVNAKCSLKAPTWTVKSDKLRIILLVLSKRIISFYSQIWTVRITLVRFYVPTGDFRDFIAAFQYLKGAWKKVGNRHFSRSCCNRTTGNGSKLKDRYKEEVFYHKNSETLQQVA